MSFDATKMMVVLHSTAHSRAERHWQEQLDWRQVEVHARIVNSTGDAIPLQVSMWWFVIDAGSFDRQETNGVVAADVRIDCAQRQGKLESLLPT